MTRKDMLDAQDASKARDRLRQKLRFQEESDRLAHKNVEKEHQRKRQEELLKSAAEKLK